MRLTRKWLVFLVIAVPIAVLEALQLLGYFNVQWIFSNLGFVLVAIIFVAFMGFIGSLFLGMYISARMFSTQGFTPFEEEMLRMRQEVKEIRESVEELKKRVPSNGPVESAPGPARVAAAANGGEELGLPAPGDGGRKP